MDSSDGIQNPSSTRGRECTVDHEECGEGQLFITTERVSSTGLEFALEDSRLSVLKNSEISMTPLLFGADVIRCTNSVLRWILSPWRSGSNRRLGD